VTPGRVAALDRCDLPPGLDTPALVIDEPILDRNIERMARLAAEHGVALRPHAKTHKSPAIAAKQIAQGAAGLTVSTTEEATVFGDAGFEDLLLAYPPVGAPRIERLRTLLTGNCRVILCVDDLGAAAMVSELAASLDRRLAFYWEVDSGGHRLGTAPGRPTVDGVVAAARLPGLDFRGLMTHAGHGYGATSEEELRRISLGEGQCLVDTAEQLRAVGVAVETVSVGSSPTAAVVMAVPGVTEARPGTYVFNDATQVALGVARTEDCALTVVTTVVGKRDGDRAVVDSGSKSIPKEFLSSRVEGYGIVVGHPALVLERLYEEHGVLAGEGVGALELGDQLRIIPNHACTATSLYDRAVVARAGRLGELAIEAVRRFGAHH